VDDLPQRSISLLDVPIWDAIGRNPPISRTADFFLRISSQINDEMAIPGMFRTTERWNGRDSG